LEKLWKRNILKLYNDLLKNYFDVLSDADKNIFNERLLTKENLRDAILKFNSQQTDLISIINPEKLEFKIINKLCKVQSIYQDDNIYVLLSIPFVKKQEPFDLIHLHSVPAMIVNVFSYINVDNIQIAVNKQHPNAYTVMKNVNENCKKFKEIFYCNNMNQMFVNNENDCISQILKFNTFGRSSFTNINAICEVRIFKSTRPILIKMKNHQSYIISTPFTINAIFKGTDNSFNKYITIDVGSHIIQSDGSGVIEIENSILEFIDNTNEIILVNNKYHGEYFHTSLPKKD